MKITNLIEESVSFFLDMEDHGKDYEDVLNLCFLIKRKFFQYLKDKPFFYKSLEDQAKNRSRYIDVDGDGDDHFNKTGIINFYTKGAISETFKKDFFEILDTVLRYIESDSKGQIKFGPTKVEGNKTAYAAPREKPSESDFSSVHVVRIPVVKNEYDGEILPQMDLSNDNAIAFIKAIGLGDDDSYGGHIEHKDIGKVLMKIRNLSDNKLQSATREPSDSRGSARVGSDGSSIVTGPRIMDQGVDIDRVRRYLDTFENLLTTAQKKGVGVSWG